MEQTKKKPSFSFEIFPPKKTSNFETVTQVISSLASFNPDYISVTYGAGGSMKDNRTVELCKIIKRDSNVTPVAHLTCVGSTKKDLTNILDELKQNGISNVLALRGDKNDNVTCDGVFKHANELISFIKENYGDYFKIAAACYPTGHSESENQKSDIVNLRNKVNCGVDHLITQLFFDNEEFLRFRDLCDMADINVPIHAGIMPITNKRQIERTVQLSSASIPSRFSKLIARYGDNDNAMFDAGISFAIEQICELLSHGVDGIHLYTMNNPLVAQRIKAGISGLLEF